MRWSFDITNRTYEVLCKEVIHKIFDGLSKDAKTFTVLTPVPSAVGKVHGSQYRSDLQFLPCQLSN